MVTNKYDPQLIEARCRGLAAPRVIARTVRAEEVTHVDISASGDLWRLGRRWLLAGRGRERCYRNPQHDHKDRHTRAVIAAHDHARASRHDYRLGAPPRTLVVSCSATHPPPRA